MFIERVGDFLAQMIVCRPTQKPHPQYERKRLHASWERSLYRRALFVPGTVGLEKTPRRNHLVIVQSSRNKLNSERQLVFVETARHR